MRLVDEIQLRGIDIHLFNLDQTQARALQDSKTSIVLSLNTAQVSATKNSDYDERYVVTRRKGPTTDDLSSLTCSTNFINLEGYDALQEANAPPPPPYSPYHQQQGILPPPVVQREPAPQSFYTSPTTIQISPVPQYEVTTRAERNECCCCCCTCPCWVCVVVFGLVSNLLILLF